MRDDGSPGAVVRDPMVLSVLIVTYNRREDVRRCLASLIPSLPDVRREILVVDNGSTDGTPEMIRERFPAAEVTVWEQNRGLAPALRWLSERAAGKWILFLDSDTVLEEGSIGPLLEFAEANPRLGAAGPLLIDPTGEIQRTSRRFPTPWNALFGRQTLLSRLWPGNPILREYLKATEHSGTAPFRCDWVSLGAALVRREALDDAGSIDAGYFIYWVDADLFLQMKKKGWEVWCYPGSRIVHMESNRTNRVRSPVGIIDFHRGALRYYYKNHGWRGANPLLWLGAAGLTGRAAIHLAVNHCRKLRARKT